MYNDLKKFLKGSKIILSIYRFLEERFFRMKGLLIRHYLIKSYFKQNQIRKLQIGASTCLLDGWLNTDLNTKSGKVVFLDATKSFPFQDNTFSYVFSEHVIEHLAYTEGMFMLHECYRILEPGGRIRIATPSLENLICLYPHVKNNIQEQYVDWFFNKFLPEIGANANRETFVINNAFRNWGHQFIYDFPTLKNLMEEVGFIDMTYKNYGESDDINLRNIESHGKDIGNEELARFETIIIEAKRPPLSNQ